MLAVSRADRIAEFMREEISSIILHELADPRIGFVTVTGVDVSPDLAQATVSVSVMGTDAQKRTCMRGLRHSAAFIQSEVFRRMRIKRAPEILFELDERVERSYRLSELIREARRSDPDGGRIPTAPAEPPSEDSAGDDASAASPSAGEDEPPIEEV